MTGLATFLFEACKKNPDAPAIRTLSDEDVSFAALDRKARGLAAALLTTVGLRPGDRVALAMANHPEYFTILFGAWAAGICVAPMNPRLHPREFAGLMQDCDALVCFATREIAGALAGDVRLVDCSSPEYRALLETPPLDALPDVESSAPAWLFYTSGTTGKPKGATLTHRNLAAMTDSFVTDAGVAVGEAMLHIAPMSHAGGLLGLAYVRNALPQFVPPPDVLTPPLFAQALKTAGKSSFFAVPTIVNMLVEPAFLAPGLHGHIHKIMFGGAPMYVEDMRRAINCFGAERLWSGYGQGEAPCTISHLPSEALGDVARPDYEELLGSVGVPRTGVEIRILDENDNELAAGEVGEVAVRGDVVMAGYWNMPEASAAALRSGWLHTGDLGRIGETGLLTLIDRSKDMIISGGSNIYPREIEEVLIAHPGVREAAIVGAPDAQWGEIAIAFIVGDVSEAALDAFCLDHIARFKRPKRYIFVKELPKSSYGKILKSELRSMLVASS